jgi:hypothetical protein
VEEVKIGGGKNEEYLTSESEEESQEGREEAQGQAQTLGQDYQFD